MDDAQPPGHESFWPWVMCLLGLNYFSTLAYHPSLAFQAAGPLAPLATLVLVALTLFGAVPVLRRVAKKSPLGWGSIGLNRRFFGGWFGRALTVACLGFAAADFVLTQTISAAAAAGHLIHNPLWTRAPAAFQDRMFLATALLVAAGAFFLRDLRKLIVAAGVLVGAYVSLSLVIIASGVWHLAAHPDIVGAWWESVAAGQWPAGDAPAGGGGAISILVACLLVYPKLAIGLCGLETATAVMPLVRGDADDNPKKPLGRIRETRKLVTSAAVVMSLLLVGASVVTSMLLRPGALVADGPAANRALAFIAHGETATPISPLFGPTFGTIYDISSVAILWLAAASAVSLLVHLAPRYASSVGTKQHRTASSPSPDPFPQGRGVWKRSLVIAALGVCLVVTWLSGASVERQAGPYLAAVLTLISADCLAVTLVDWKRRRGAWYKKLSWRYLFVMLIFLYGAAAIMIEQPAGLWMAAAFIVAAIVVATFGRARGGGAGKPVL